MIILKPERPAGGRDQPSLTTRVFLISRVPVRLADEAGAARRVLRPAAFPASRLV